MINFVLLKDNLDWLHYWPFGVKLCVWYISVGLVVYESFQKFGFQLDMFDY